MARNSGTIRHKSALVLGGATNTLYFLLAANRMTTRHVLKLIRAPFISCCALVALTNGLPILLLRAMFVFEGEL